MTFVEEGDAVGANQLVVERVTAANAAALMRFAEREPLEFTDFGSIALTMPEEPRVLASWVGDQIVAAAIDDGLAMSVAGDHQALSQLALALPDSATKLVIAGRDGDVRAFTQTLPPRRLRPEHFMAVRVERLRAAGQEAPLRIADPSDLPLLLDARVCALEEEYSMAVDRSGKLYTELEQAVARAVKMQGVAIWVDDGAIAFTAQLIAKTPEAAMFGDLYTDPRLRGAGRATIGLHSFCVWLMSESRHVTLRVGVDNQPALRLYERVGFERVGSFLSSLRKDS